MYHSASAVCRDYLGTEAPGLILNGIIVDQTKEVLRSRTLPPLQRIYGYEIYLGSIEIGNGRNAARYDTVFIQYHVYSEMVNLMSMQSTYGNTTRGTISFFSIVCIL